MPRNKTVTFREYVRQLSKEHTTKNLPEVTPDDIHQKLNDEGLQLKVTVSDEMRDYWQAKLDENPEDDTAMRILYIADAGLTLVDGIGYEDDEVLALNGEFRKVFTLESINADGFEFDLPYGFEIRTADELDAITSGIRQHAKVTSFQVEVFKSEENRGDKAATEPNLSDQQKDLKKGITRASPAPPKEAMELLRLARKQGNNSPTDIYNWLVSENEKSSADPLFEYLDFCDKEGTRFTHYGKADKKENVRSEYVLSWNNHPKKGSTFENWCSASKK